MGLNFGFSPPPHLHRGRSIGLLCGGLSAEAILGLFFGSYRAEETRNPLLGVLYMLLYVLYPKYLTVAQGLSKCRSGTSADASAKGTFTRPGADLVLKHPEEILNPGSRTVSTPSPSLPQSCQVWRCL